MPGPRYNPTIARTPPQPPKPPKPPGPQQPRTGTTSQQQASQVRQLRGPVFLPGGTRPGVQALGPNVAWRNPNAGQYLNVRQEGIAGAGGMRGAVQPQYLGPAAGTLNYLAYQQQQRLRYPVNPELMRLQTLTSMPDALTLGYPRFPGMPLPTTMPDTYFGQWQRRLESTLPPPPGGGGGYGGGYGGYGGYGDYGGGGGGGGQGGGWMNDLTRWII